MPCTATAVPPLWEACSCCLPTPLSLAPPRAAAPGNLLSADSARSYDMLLPPLLDSGVRVMIYSGECCQRWVVAPSIVESCLAACFSTSASTGGWSEALRTLALRTRPPPAAGQLDFICNTAGNSRMLDRLMWSREKAWAAAKAKRWSVGGR